MEKTILKTASIFGLTAVILGAFGAHALKAQLTPDQLASFQTGVRYQFIHTLALIAVGVLLLISSNKMLRNAAWAFTIGIILFSGSIYLLTAGKMMGWSVSWLGPITPLGGVSLIVGWVMFFFGVGKMEK